MPPKAPNPDERAVEFDALVEQLERRYAGRYAALARRTALVVAVGYAGFLLWVGAWALAGFACFAGALYAPPFGSNLLVCTGAALTVFAVWQAANLLWLRQAPDKSVPLGASEAPQFFALLDELRRTLRCPRLHVVTAMPELNAHIRQRPRLGVFGWPRNELRVGLALMDVLTPDEFKSVLAHECAHISKRHGRFGAWIYRTRDTWELLFARLSAPPRSSFSRWGRLALGRFMQWYWPRFHAYFFAMSRVHERQADAAAANCAGVDATASALWKIDLISRRLDRDFWPAVWRTAAQQPEPPEDISRRLSECLATTANPGDVERWRQQAITAITDSSDTHPCLAERLASLGASAAEGRRADFPVLPPVSAAQALFGERLDALRASLDRLWHDEASTAWRAQYARAAVLERRSAGQAARDSRRVGDDAAAADLWEEAQRVLHLSGGADAEPLLRQLLSLRPRHAAANLALGVHYVEQGNEEGVRLLWVVAEQTENDAATAACHALARHYQATGQVENLRDVNARLGRWEDRRDAARRELDEVTVHDTFTEANLPLDAAEALAAALASDEALAEAYLVRKSLQYASQPLFVLCVRTRPGWWGRSNSERDMALADRLRRRLELPGRTLVVAPRGPFKSLARKIMRLPGSRVFPAPV